MAAIPGGNLIDGSGALTAAATSEEVFAQNVSRQYLLIQAHDEDMWVNFGTAAVQSQPSIRIPSGGSLEFSWGSTGVVPTGSVNIISATISSEYTAKQA